MIDIGTLALAAVDIVAIAGIVTGIRWLGRAESGSIAGPFSIPSNPPWPRGVQEEEPQAWHVERLNHRATTAAANRIAQPHRATTDTARRPSPVVD